MFPIKYCSAIRGVQKHTCDNNLSVVNFIADLSARLIANKSAYKFKGEIINEMMNKLAK